MNRLSLRFIGDMALRERAAPVTEINDEIRNILTDMERVMRAEKGAGLAAPQVGLPLRMLIFSEIENDGMLYKMINPAVLRKSREESIIEEGCLSVQGPGGPVFASVARPSAIEVEWTDENGAARRDMFDGYAARAILHEIDHLDGILFIDYLSSAKREMVMRKVKKRRGS